MRTFQKPLEGECLPYAYEMINLVPDDGLVLQHLQTNVQAWKGLVGNLPEEHLITPCADGEWTIKEIIAHLIDSERIYAYRALRFARNDTTELAGFEQDDYVYYAGANQRSLDDLLDELIVVRQATIALFSRLDEEAMQRAGVANGHKLSVRAALYIIAGHELHHVESLKENYL